MFGRILTLLGLAASLCCSTSGLASLHALCTASEQSCCCAEEPVREKSCCSGEEIPVDQLTLCGCDHPLPLTSGLALPVVSLELPFVPVQRTALLYDRSEVQRLAWPGGNSAARLAHPIPLYIELQRFLL